MAAGLQTRFLEETWFVQHRQLKIGMIPVEIYEDTHYPMGTTSDPISMIEFVMDQQGLTRKDLEPYIGPRQRVWDVMERRRPLSLAMMRRLE